MTIRIPQQGKFSITNQSDLSGNIWYTRNLNFDEKGYIKIASRSVLIKSSETTANFGLMLSFGRRDTTGDSYLVTDNQPYIGTITETAITITEDVTAGNPDFDDGSWGTWWMNRWYTSIDTGEVWYRDNSGWVQSYTGLTTGVVHALEVFRNKKTLCISNGNEIIQLDSGENPVTSLTIPEDYQIIGLSYQNNLMGIITLLSATNLQQNQNAFFFTWNGSSDNADAGFDIGSETIMAICAYKSSWVILTREGQLLYFNGGGFDVITQIPLYYMNILWGNSGSRTMFGDVMWAKGDFLYINVPSLTNSYGKPEQKYVENFPGGILCYDPQVGLYHKYSPSNSIATIISVSNTNINVSTDTFTTANPIPDTGSMIKYANTTSNTNIGNFTVGQTFYVIKVTSTTFRLATTYQNSLDNIPVNILSQGDNTSSNYFMAVTVVDYGNSYFKESGGVGSLGTANQVYDSIIYSDMTPNLTGVNVDDSKLLLNVPGFQNKGYFVTPKISSQNIDDNYLKVYIKYRPLDDLDSIVVKYKNKDIIGLPVTTPQNGGLLNCTWTSNMVMTTNADISKAYLAYQSGEDLECEIISGAGAGNMPQILSISLLAGTYTVTLAESIIGATNARTCNILINNWKVLKTSKEESIIDSSNTKGYAEYPIAKSSKWIKLKVIMTGINTTIEELQLINKLQQPTQ